MWAKIPKHFVVRFIISDQKKKIDKMLKFVLLLVTLIAVSEAAWYKTRMYCIRAGVCRPCDTIELTATSYNSAYVDASRKFALIGNF